MTVEDQLVAQEGLGLVVGRCIVLVYTNKCVMGLRCWGWLQGVLNLFIGLFLRYELVANAVKSKVMIFQIGTLSSGIF